MLSVKILEIHRLNRKIRVEDEIKYVSSRTLCIKLVGQTLPQCVNIFNHKYPVFPYIPKARISCFHVGHLSKVCKSQTRCVTCGGQKHDSLNDCPLKLSPPKCVNCGESHLATSHECPEVIRHKMALSLISSTNISYSEAKKVYSPYILLHPFLPLLIPGMISIISLTLGGSVFLHDFFEIIGVKLHCSLDALIHIFNVYRHPNSQTPHRILNNFFYLYLFFKYHLILGDFNTHYPAWGDPRLNVQGERIEICDDRRFSILNDGYFLFPIRHGDLYYRSNYRFLCTSLALSPPRKRILVAVTDNYYNSR